ncbi:MAG TPA: hypothetical protein VNW04_18645, partial [Puia sp.]|nr:hypothetical protein [Puia sp.]
MQKIAAYCGVALLCLAFANVDAQTVDSITDKAIRFPARFLSRIQSRAAGLNDQLSRQTQRYLQKIVQREEKLRQKITAVDPAGAQQLFNGSAERYAALAGRLKADSGGTPT